MLEGVSRDRDRIRVVQGPHADELEGALDPRPGADEQLGRRRSDLRDERDRSGLDVREQRIEQALRAPRVLTCEERLLQLGDDPHDVLARDGVHERLHAPLQLADVDGAGVDLCSGRLEHERVVVHSVESRAGQGGLADAVLADEQYRTRR